MEKISILIVEDSLDYQQGLIWLLSTDTRLSVVGVLTDAIHVGAEVNRLRPHVVLLDHHLGTGPSGLDALPIILAAAPETQVIMLTTFDNDDLILKAIHLGANGYILKANAATALIHDIFMVVDGGSPMTGCIARRVLLLMRKAEQNLLSQLAAANTDELRDYADRLGLLTPREEEVLKCLTEGKSYKLIADHLGIAFETVSNHLRAIYRKLQVNSMSEAVAIALRVWLASGKA